MNSDPRAVRGFLRHTVATLAYRGEKAIRGAPPSFTGFKASPTTRTPGEVLAHVCDLLDWALRFCRGENLWKGSTPQDWEADSKRFFAALGSFDAYLASDEPLGVGIEKLFQGPVADALTHIGQIAMLRRMAGSPVRGENYFKAGIAAGTVGPDQPAPRLEFD